MHHLQKRSQILTLVRPKQNRLFQSGAGPDRFPPLCGNRPACCQSDQNTRIGYFTQSMPKHFYEWAFLRTPPKPLLLQFDAHVIGKWSTFFLYPCLSFDFGPKFPKILGRWKAPTGFTKIEPQRLQTSSSTFLLPWFDGFKLILVSIYNNFCDIMQICCCHASRGKWLFPLDN